MSGFKHHLKRILFGALGKEPEAVVASFICGNEGRAQAMLDEFRRLVPDRRYLVIRLGSEPSVGGDEIVVAPGSAWQVYRRLGRALRRWRIGQAAVLFDGEPAGRALRRASFLLAPGRILAYNANLERHHLRLRSWIASWLFLRGVPLDRIFLRPRWICPWRRDRTICYNATQTLDGRAVAPHRPKVAVLTPYFPYPLSHGGAVRIFNLLREAARRFDIFLFAFTESDDSVEAGPVLEFCAKAVLVPKPRYREPRWSSLRPPEVCEYRSPAMRRALDRVRREEAIELLQVEYTQLASYGGDVLVEHDVTFDLYEQIHAKRRTLSSWWDMFRWRRFERRAVARYRRVIAMSEKDRTMLAAPQVIEIPNGVDLDRFRPSAEGPGQRLLFIGSFRHFPNVIAFRFVTEEVWPLLREEFPSMTLTVVAGPDARSYWAAAASATMPPLDPRIRLLEFVRDVRPLYQEANLVLAPTLVSAGTNIKVLEAMAMERAVVSTTSGCAGLGLEHGRSVWIADTARLFADGVRKLLREPGTRRAMAQAARLQAEARFDWRRLGAMQRRAWSELLPSGTVVRPASAADLDRIAAIQSASPEASAWTPESYLAQGCLVACAGGTVAGFLAYRDVGGESEILNLAVAPEKRRNGVGGALVAELLAQAPGPVFLEVRVSNHDARKLYEKQGFRQVGLRPSYYHTPPEDGIVMKFQKC